MVSPVKSFSIAVIPNTVVQPEKNVILQLFTPTNAILSAPSAATLNIIDTSGSLVVPAGSVLTSGELFAPRTTSLIRVKPSLFCSACAPVVVPTYPVSPRLCWRPIGINSPSGSQNYGGLTVDGPSVFRPFSFTGHGTNSQLIAATLQLNNGLTNIGHRRVLPTPSAHGRTFIPTMRKPLSSMMIQRRLLIRPPLPSATSGGALLKSTVIFSNIYHTSPADVDALLVSTCPAGYAVDVTCRRTERHQGGTGVGF